MIRFLPILIFIAGVFPQQIQLESTVEPDTITVGDHVRLTVTADVAAGKAVNFPELVSQSEEMTIINRILTENSVTYILAFWEIGALEIPGIPVEILENGQISATLVTDPVPVTVTSVLDVNAQDIRHIKGLHAVKINQSQTLFLLVLLAVSVALTILFFRKRQRKIERAQRWTKPADPPHIHAARQLEALKKPALLTPETAESFYLELSSIFRQYLENEFFFRAMEMTTTELEDFLKTVTRDDTIGSDTMNLLQRSDLSKFARHIPGYEAMDQDVVLTQSLIDRYHQLVHNGIETST